MQGAELTGEWLMWLWRASWQAAVLVLLVLLVQWIFRAKLSPGWRHALWLLVVARLVMPVLPESSLSIFNFARVERGNVVSSAGAPAAVETVLVAAPPASAPTFSDPAEWVDVVAVEQAALVFPLETDMGASTFAVEEPLQTTTNEQFTRIWLRSGVHSQHNRRCFSGAPTFLSALEFGIGTFPVLVPEGTIGQ